MSKRFIPAQIYAIFIITIVLIIASSSTFAADFSAPLVDLPRAKQSKSSLTLSAIVDDDTAVASVKLYYRIIGNTGKYTVIPLKPLKNVRKTYAVTLAIEPDKQKGVEYYVEAYDVANNVTQEPFPNTPKQILFQQSVAKNTRPILMKSGSFKQGLYWGGNLSVGNFTVDDPDGNTDAVFAPSVGVMMSYSPTPRWRIWSELNQQDFTLPYSETNIGQKVTSARFELIAQRSFPILKSMVWAGAGIGYEQISASDRSNQVDGVTSKPQDDRDVTGLGLIIDFGFELGPWGNKLIGLNGKIYNSLDNGLNGVAVGIYMNL